MARAGSRKLLLLCAALLCLAGTARSQPEPMLTMAVAPTTEGGAVAAPVADTTAATTEEMAVAAGLMARARASFAAEMRRAAPLRA